MPDFLCKSSNIPGALLCRRATLKIRNADRLPRAKAL
jgi:hypothetical protein